MAPDDQQIAGFIQSSFGSVWTLELLLHLARAEDRAWTADELVAVLRASESIVAQGLDALLAAGLIVIDEAAGARYRPASPISLRSPTARRGSMRKGRMRCGG